MAAAAVSLKLDLHYPAEFTVQASKEDTCGVCKQVSKQTLKDKEFVICPTCAAIHDPKTDISKIFPDTKAAAPAGGDAKAEKKAKELIYNHSTGELSGGRLEKPFLACSGNMDKGGRRKNCHGGYHSKQYVSSIGPIPCGLYSIAKWQQTKNTSPQNFGGLGCYFLRPVNGQMLHGRSGFLIHPGEVTANPSEGCICLTGEDFKAIKGQVEDTLLRVISGGGDAAHDAVSPVQPPVAASS